MRDGAITSKITITSTRGRTYFEAVKRGGREERGAEWGDERVVSWSFVFSALKDCWIGTPDRDEFVAAPILTNAVPRCRIRVSSRLFAVQKDWNSKAVKRGGHEERGGRRRGRRGSVGRIRGSTGSGIVRLLVILNVLEAAA